jgi:hypothetical protein
VRQLVFWGVVLKLWQCKYGQLELPKIKFSYSGVVVTIDVYQRYLKHYICKIAFAIIAFYNIFK